MRILYHHRVASKDGQYVHIDELTGALNGLGHEIIMVCPRVAEKNEFGSDGGLVPYLKKHVPKSIYELTELAYSFLAFGKLLVVILKRKPDCLYERYNLNMVAGVWIKKIFRIPMLLEVNAPILDERSKYDGIALPWLARWGERYVWNNADRVLPVTRVLADRIVREGVPEARIKVIPNGINRHQFREVIDAIRAKKDLGLDGRFVLGFTGFIRTWHRLDKVVDLLLGESDGEERHLLVVGDGPARVEVEGRARELGVSDRLTITGVVGRDQVASYVSAFDIALQPDVVPYASPLKLFEYLALGRAIIAPDSENIREVLTDRENALLFDPEKPESFVNTIETLCSESELRKSLSCKAKSTINERGFTWLNNARTVESLYHELGVGG